jgi:hypothetical protein
MATELHNTAVVNGTTMPIPGMETEAAERAQIPAHKPDGPLAGMLLASGLGTFFLGLFVSLAEARPGFKDFMQLNDRVGPLSGKSIFSSLIFVVSAAVLVPLLRQRDGLVRPALIAFAVLTALGFLLTFPPIFQAFA